MITANHIDLVNAMVLRMAVLGHTSLYRSWVSFGSGAFGDEWIAKHCTRKSFAMLLRMITYFDVAKAKYDHTTGRLHTGNDKSFRMQGLRADAEKAWAKNWTVGQRIAGDERGSLGAHSKFTPGSMRHYNTSKPIKNYLEYLMACCAETGYPQFMHFSQAGTKCPDGEEETSALKVLTHCWNPSWTGKGHIWITDSRWCNIEMFRLAWQKGAAVIATASQPKGRKSKGGDNDGATGTEKTVNPFTQMAKVGDTAMPRGTMRRAVKTFTVPGTRPMTLQATQIKDSKAFVVVHSTAVGTTSELTMKRWCRQGKKKVDVPSFLALQEHSAYGGVDRLNKDTAEVGARFQLEPWYMHQWQSILNVQSTAMWILVSERLKGVPDDTVLKEFRIKGQGITCHQKFVLSLTEKVIERAISCIESEGSYDPRPKHRNQHTTAGTNVTTPGSTGKRGRPRRHEILKAYQDKSRYCQACYAKAAAANKALSKDQRMGAAMIKKKCNSTKHGCMGCGMRVCSACAVNWVHRGPGVASPPN